MITNNDSVSEAGANIALLKKELRNKVVSQPVRKANVISETEEVVSL